MINDSTHPNNFNFSSKLFFYDKINYFIFHFKRGKPRFLNKWKDFSLKTEVERSSSI